MDHMSDHVSDHVSERGDDSGIESSAADSGDGSIYIQVVLPEQRLQKYLQFHHDDTVWAAKQQVIMELGKDLRDQLNYGLYSPPANGRAGKFLDEERLLKDYPLAGPIGYLEFKYKRRVYKLMQVNQRKLKQLHSKTNLKQFVDCVKKHDILKITKLTNRGLDPNFHDHDTLETPLILATQQPDCRTLIMTLISGGAHLDFRNKQGMTPMHRAAERGNYEAIKILLDLGASPNYKDLRGVTPLYCSVANDTGATCTELLLRDHAVVGICDDTGWTEVHQACRAGRIQHLEHLLFYGSDMNVQNSNGNTPLHVTAINNQESCARLLLFRGADKCMKNYANRDAFEEAVIAGNTELAAVIQSFQHHQVVPFQEMPTYNAHRRQGAACATLQKMQRCRSNPNLADGAYSLGGSRAPSPAGSHGSLPPWAGRRGGAGGESQEGSVDGRSGGAEYDSPRLSVSSSGSFGSFASDSGPMRLLNGSHTDSPRDEPSPYWAERRRGSDAPTEPRLPLAVIDQVKMRNKGVISPYAATPVKTGPFVVRPTPPPTPQWEEDAPRFVILQKSTTGYGFVLRGAKVSGESHNGRVLPCSDLPSQFLDRVDSSSVADRVGLRTGDYILEINSECVISARHQHVVDLIQASVDTLSLKVVSAGGAVRAVAARRGTRVAPRGATHAHLDGTSTLPMPKRGHVRSDPSDASDSCHLSALAAVHGVDTTNVTASIRRHSKRMASVPIDEIFPGGGDGGGVGGMHVTRVAVPGRPREPTPPTVGAVPVGVVVPPPPRHQPPAPPARAVVVPIRTPPQHNYANVSADIQAQRTAAAAAALIAQDDSLYESSFRPGTNARLSKEPEGTPTLPRRAAPAAAPPRAADDSASQLSTGSSRSSGSSGSQPIRSLREAKTALTVVTTNGAVHRGNDPATASRADSPATVHRGQRAADVPVVMRRNDDLAAARHEDSSFSNAIKTAALAREQREGSGGRVTSKPTAKPPPPLSRPGGVPPPPPPPKTAPPTAAPPPLVASKPAPAAVPDSHAALMAAIAKRRQVVDNSDMAGVATSMADRLERREPANVFPAAGHQAAPPPQRPVVNGDAVAKVTPPPPRRTTPVTTTVTTSARTPVTAVRTVAAPTNGSDDDKNFTARAEKARREWLQKRAAAQTASPGEKEEEEEEKKKRVLRKGVTPAPPPSLGGLADLIAEKAARRQQQSGEGNNNSSGQRDANGRPAANRRVYGAAAATKGQQAARPPSIQLSGVTLDSSVTDAAGGRARMFERDDAPPPLVSGRTWDEGSEGAGYGVEGEGGAAVGWLVEPALAGGGVAALKARLAASMVVTACVAPPSPMPPPPPASPLICPAAAALPPPPPELDDAASTVSSLSTLSTLSSTMDHDATLTAPDELFAPPPPGFTDDDFIPPPVHFGASRLTPKMADWSVSDVAVWLADVDLDAHRDAFRTQGVDGRALTQLGRARMIALGLVRIDERMKLERAVQKAMLD